MANTASQAAYAGKLSTVIPVSLPARDLNPESGGTRQQLRRDLMRLILEPGPGSRHRLAALAAEAEWPLPPTVTLVVARAPGVPSPAAGIRAAEVLAQSTAVLDGEVLADLTGTDAHLLVPGPVARSRGPALASALADWQVAMGLTVPLATAADSLRWARRALSLAESGAIDAGPLIWCEDHLLTLWLLADPRLADLVVRQQLSLLAHLTRRQRARILDTLGPWLETRGTAAEIAALLHVHPQTVRYRIRQIERAFGDRLADPDTRFVLELALRVMRVRQRQAAPPRPRTPAGK